MRARNRFLFFLLLLLGFTRLASAQAVDAYLGLNTMMSANDPTRLDLRGGLFPQVGGDIIFFHGLGFGADVAWRGSQSVTDNTVYRPLFYDFNLVWEPLGSAVNINPVLEAGIGAQSLRVYQGYYHCGTFSGCSNYFSSNHFATHLGAALRIYITSHIFLAPTAQFYFIRNNTEFGVGSTRMFGISLGYTLRASPF